MAGKSYTAWEGGAEFVESLRANRTQLEAFMARHSPEQRRQMADGLAEYMTQAVARDPNAMPMGLSETLDAVREGKSKDGKILGSLKGIKNDFYNLFDNHPNVMLTTGGVIGLGGGLSLLKHYGLDSGTTGGLLTSVGNVIFQSEKLVTLSTGPARKKMETEDDSLSGELAAALEGKVPNGMDPNSPEGRMVKESGKAMSGAFREMVKHREMVIGNLLVAGETFQTGGFVTDAYLDKKNIAGMSEDALKGARRTAKGGMVNAVSNTLLMGLTYYNQYIDPKLQELDKKSPTYKEDKAKVWENAPNQHLFKPGRACAHAIAAMPERVRGWVPNAAIVASFLPLTGMVMQGMKGKDGGIVPFQLFGSLAVMANVLVNYTAITNRSKGQKILSPEEVGAFADVVVEAAKQQVPQGAPVDAGEVEALKGMMLSQSFIAPEHEGLVEQKLKGAFDLPFAAVRDHSRTLPTTREPMVLPGSHGLAQAVLALGAEEADITPEGAALLFRDAPKATQLAVGAINGLAESGSHIAKSLGGIQAQPTQDGRVQIQMQTRALPALVNAAKVLAAEPDAEAFDKAELAVKVQQALQATPSLPNLAPQQPQQKAAGR